MSGYNKNNPKRRRDDHDEEEQTPSVPSQPDNNKEKKRRGIIMGEEGIQSNNSNNDNDNNHLCAEFYDLESAGVISYVFPFFESRSDFNSLATVNSALYKSTKENNSITPPWPQVTLRTEGNKPGVGCGLLSPIFSSDGTMIAFTTTTGEIHLFHQKTGLVKNWKAHDRIQGNTNLVFSPSGKFLMSVGVGVGVDVDDNTNNIIKLWDVTSNCDCLQEWTQKGVVNSCVLSPDGQILATFDSNYSNSACKVYLNKLADDTISHLPIRASQYCKTLAFSSGSCMVAWGGNDNNDGRGIIQLRNIDAAEDSYYSTLVEESNCVIIDLAFSSGLGLVSASNDGTIKLWDIATKRCVRTFNKGHHNNPVNSISFVPGNEILFSGSNDRTIQIWDVITGKCLEVIRRDEAVSKLQLSPDGCVLLTKEGYDMVRLRRISATMINELCQKAKHHRNVHRKQQRLLLLRHVAKCQCENGNCPVTPNCAAMKKLWEHIEHCKSNQCTIQHCLSTRYLLVHYRQCKDARCLVCGPVRKTIRLSHHRGVQI